MPSKFVLLTMTLLVIAYHSLSAQDIPTTGLGGGTGRNIADHMLIQEANKTLYDAPEENVKGSPYLVRDFVKGDIRSSKGNFEAVEMRYNIHQDIIEFKQSNFIYILDPSPDIHLVDIGEHKLVVQKGLKNRAYGFYELLDSGRVTLLAKKAVNYREGRPPQALESAPTPARYTNIPDTYYYSVENGPLIKVTSLKKMIAGFPDQHDQLKAFASKEKISSNKGDELARLVKYYNSLQ